MHQKQLTAFPTHCLCRRPWLGSECAPPNNQTITQAAKCLLNVNNSISLQGRAFKVNGSGQHPGFRHCSKSKIRPSAPDLGRRPSHLTLYCSQHPSVSTPVCFLKCQQRRDSPSTGALYRAPPGLPKVQPEPGSTRTGNPSIQHTMGHPGPYLHSHRVSNCFWSSKTPVGAWKRKQPGPQGEKELGCFSPHLSPKARRYVRAMWPEVTVS